MSEKPIIVNLDRNNADDFVKTTDYDGNQIEQKGLCKQVPNNYLRQTFQELVDYIVYPESDELNDAYSSDEVNLAKKIEAASASQGAYLLHRKGGEVNETFRIYLSDSLDKYFSQIVEPKEISIQGSTQSYKSIDLFITVDNGGGLELSDYLHE
jgi:hypothetical protein